MWGHEAHAYRFHNEDYFILLVLREATLAIYARAIRLTFQATDYRKIIKHLVFVRDASIEPESGRRQNRDAWLGPIADEGTSRMKYSAGV